MLKQSSIKSITMLAIFVAFCILMGCKRTKQPLFSPDVGEFLPGIMGSYTMSPGFGGEAEIVVLQRSTRNLNGYEFLQSKGVKREIRLVKLGNWNFIETPCGKYYCIWRYTNDDGVITLYTVDDAANSSSRTAEFLRSLKLEGVPLFSKPPKFGDTLENTPPTEPVHSTLETIDLQRAFRNYADTFSKVDRVLRKIN